MINVIKYSISQTQTHFSKSSNSHLYTQNHLYTLTCRNPSNPWTRRESAV